MPVPSGRVDHVRSQDAADDPDDVVRVSAEGDRLDEELSRGDLTDDRVADRTDGELVDSRPAEHHPPRSQRGGLGVLVPDKVHAAHDTEHDAESALAVEVERPSTESPGHQGPGSEDADTVDSVLTEDEREGGGSGKSSLLKEIVAVPGKRVSGQVLDRPDHADDFGSTTVDTGETLLVGRAGGHLSLHGGGVGHHLQDRVMEISTKR